MRSSHLVWFVAYLLMVAAIFVGLRRARTFSMASYGTDSAQQNWDQWRNDVREHVASKGTTQRKVPKSPQPPALVLMQDHYGACLAFALVLSTALFLATMFIARGAMRPTVIRAE